ncbi:response regulator transcription factor [Reichenbachiella ulvae]|uniref:Response regulator transcription factor n=1 Tax=Reichenbachiella ulvae TaxID=2980104 RepID=A0ABT3CV97_9BACT|nr:response regulator transcription factor [Reichenbachiella ulvae]MCV9387621.1 response regulator transcription factor [Reichenbachiella ulvae]
MKEGIRILIVDDHKMFLQGLHSILKDQEEIEVVDTVSSGEEAIQLLEGQPIDVVLTDVSMPGVDGIQLSQYIKKELPNTKVLVLSTHSDPATIHQLISAQVEGYVLKNAEKEELVHGIKKVFQGEKYFSEEVQEKYTRSLFAVVPDEKPKVELSKREREILALIVEEYTAQQIAEELFISQHTVNTHRKNLLSKLRVKNTAGLVKQTLMQGLLQ